MLFLYSDFGHQGPYAGEMDAAVRRVAPKLQPVHLMHDAPAFDSEAAGCLLAALARQFQAGDVCLAVVDPGVGGARFPVAVLAGGRWYVGPDNGLLWPVAAAAGDAEWWEITWRPEVLSTSFHGRDLFAPVAAKLARGLAPEEIGCVALDEPIPQVPADLPRIVYIDRYGNAITGIRASTLTPKAQLDIAGYRIPRANTYSDVAEGAPFWYENANGLVEIAVNSGYADEELDIDVGDPFVLHLRGRRRKSAGP
jgi:S-adenosylmethionine hydrolase